MFLSTMRLLPIVVVIVSAKAEENVTENTTRLGLLDAIKNCGVKSFVLCLKEQALKYLEEPMPTVEVTDWLTFRPSLSSRATRKLRWSSLPEDEQARENVLDKVTIAKIAEFLKTYTMEMRLPVEAIKRQINNNNGLANTVNTASNLFSKPKLFLALKAVASFVAVMVLKGLSFLAFKALVLSKIAFVIAVLVAIGKATEDVSYHNGEGSTNGERHHDPHEAEYEHFKKYYGYYQPSGPAKRRDQA